MRYLLWLVFLALAACATSEQAPVVERIPASQKPLPEKPAAKPAASEKAAIAEKDQRPESYTVKKGDTLHSIGLEFGYDYKEIAQRNNIQPPYTIHIGQQIKLKESLKESRISNAPNENPDVVVTPLSSPPPLTAAPAAAAVQSNVVDGVSLFDEPKALREPYSEQAMMVTPKPPAKPVEKPSDAAATKPAEKPAETSKPDAAKPDNMAAADDEAIDWAWPAKGKLLAGFNDAASKGIDIDGKPGQSVLAAASGKVIYSGTDLRGYGKLVIIKHNRTYLSVYAHNSQILVKEGQQIAKGQKIAEMGNTDTDRVKLHFEIRRLGKSVDPAKYLPENPG